MVSGYWIGQHRSPERELWNEQSLEPLRVPSGFSSHITCPFLVQFGIVLNYRECLTSDWCKIAWVALECLTPDLLIHLNMFFFLEPSGDGFGSLLFPLVHIDTVLGAMRCRKGWGGKGREMGTRPKWNSSGHFTLAPFRDGNSRINHIVSCFFCL